MKSLASWRVLPCLLFALALPARAALDPAVVARLAAGDGRREGRRHGRPGRLGRSPRARRPPGARRRRAPGRCRPRAAREGRRGRRCRDGREGGAPARGPRGGGRQQPAAARDRVRAGGPEPLLPRSGRAPRRGPGALERRDRGDAAPGEEGDGSGDRPRRPAAARDDGRGAEVRSTDKATRIAAIRMLGSSGDPSARTLLAPIVERNPDGSFAENDDDVYRAARSSLTAVEGRVAWGQRAGLLFSGAQPRLDPAARRTRPRHHLRPHGRHQHGPRRAA